MNDILIEKNKKFKKIKKKVTGLSTILEFIIYTIPFYSDKSYSLYSHNFHKVSPKNLKTDSKKSIFHLNRISKLNNYLGNNFHTIDFNPLIPSANSMKSSSISKSINSKSRKHFDVYSKSNIENKFEEGKNFLDNNNNLNKVENDEKLIHLHNINNDD